MPQEELKCGAHFAKESAPQTPSSEASSSRDGTDDMGSSDYSTVGRSAGLMTILTIVSRVTGFIRTWAMAAAIGMSLLSSSYQVANNLPNMLYELVMGGMLVTAFLPVYMGVRREQGREASNEYVGTCSVFCYWCWVAFRCWGPCSLRALFGRNRSFRVTAAAWIPLRSCSVSLPSRFCFMVWARCFRAFSTHTATTSGRRLPRSSTM